MENNGMSLLHFAIARGLINDSILNRLDFMMDTKWKGMSPLEYGMTAWHKNVFKVNGKLLQRPMLASRLPFFCS